jgi:hypothetical protein
MQQKKLYAILTILLLVFSMLVLAEENLPPEETDVNLDEGSSSSSSGGGSGGSDGGPIENQLVINVVFPENNSIISKEMLSEKIVSSKTLFWQVKSTLKKYEMANSNTSYQTITGETIRDILNLIGKDELPSTLEDGAWKIGEQNYNYNQYLFFDSADKMNELVKYAENNDGTSADFFILKKENQL